MKKLLIAALLVLSTTASAFYTERPLGGKKTSAYRDVDIYGDGRLFKAEVWATSWENTVYGPWIPYIKYFAKKDGRLTLNLETQRVGMEWILKNWPGMGLHYISGCSASCRLSSPISFDYHTTDFGGTTTEWYTAPAITLYARQLATNAQNMVIEMEVLRMDDNHRWIIWVPES